MKVSELHAILTKMIDEGLSDAVMVFPIEADPDDLEFDSEDMLSFTEVMDAVRVKDPDSGEYLIVLEGGPFELLGSEDFEVSEGDYDN